MIIQNLNPQTYTLFPSFSLKDSNLFIENNRIIMKITISTNKLFNGNSKLSLAITSVYRQKCGTKKQFCINVCSYQHKLNKSVYEFFLI